MRQSEPMPWSAATGAKTGRRKDITMWVILATVAAGAVVGFVTGGARVSSAGHVTTGVSGFFVGAFATRPTTVNVDAYAKIFCLYILSLFAVYIVANVLRHKGKLGWIYGAKHG
jgi:hypothetical protein